MTTDYRALCAELVKLLEVSEEWSGCTQPQALTRARAALAQPKPVAPLINSGSERLRLVAVGIRSGYMAGHNATVEGYYGDPDEVASEMASMVLAELNSVPQPKPVAVAPTDEELLRLAAQAFDYAFVDGGVGGGESEFLAYARAVLARWGTPNPITEELK